MTILSSSLRLFLLAAGIMALSTPAFAQSSEPKLLGTFGDWSAYSYTDGGKPVCYILSSPKKATGAYKKRGEIFTLVTHRPAEKTRNTFSVMAGYSYKPDSTVTVTIDKQKFALFTQNDSAWAPDAGTDTRLADAMKKGASMTIKGASAKGTETVDTYGLKGTSAAFGAIDKACPAN